MIGRVMNLKVTGSICNIIWLFNWDIPSGRTVILGFTQPLPEIRVENLPWGVEGGRLDCMADNLTAICEPIF
jgi:hypothetical protein